MKKRLILLLLSLTLILFLNPSFAAKEGNITELTAVGSPYSTAGDIQFRCVTTNEGNTPIPSSTCNLTIRYGPANEYIKSIRYTVPRLDSGESYTYIWDTTNVDFPYNSFQTGGSYEITAFWNYPSGSDSRTTSFYSVPTSWLPIALISILIVISGLFMRKRENKFL